MRIEHITRFQMAAILQIAGADAVVALKLNITNSNLTFNGSILISVWKHRKQPVAGLTST